MTAKRRVNQNRNPAFCGIDQYRAITRNIRLAPPRLGATTVASWFLATFTGSLLAGLVGTLWTSLGDVGFFLLLAALALLVAGMLWRLDGPVRRLG